MSVQIQFEKFEGPTDGHHRRRIAPLSITSRWPLLPAPKPDRIVTLASLSSHIPDEFIARTLARRLNEETDSRVLLVHLERVQRSLTLRDWAKAGARANGEFCFSKNLEFLAPRTERLHVQVDIEEAGLVGSMLEHFSCHYNYVLVHVAAEASEPLLLECFAESDRTFLLLQPTSEDLYQRDLLLRQTRTLGKGENVKTIICREKGEEYFNDLLKVMGTSA